jgi:hypothetical protein
LAKKKSDIEKAAQDILNEVIEFVLLGYRFSEVLEYLEITYNYDSVQGKKLYENAKKEIVSLGAFDMDVVITQHLIRYEEAIRYFDDVGNFSAKAAAMTAKEKFLKIFIEKEPEVVVENNISVEINIATEQLYNLTKLTPEEQNRFQSLFDKVKLLK